ncbi:MAG: cupin domain-containing protein [Paracoccaceae bacterium]|nr:cupin domain-containing protein [Paracoccaceae bacterium]
MTVINRANAPHYMWAQICEGWRLLEGDDLSVTEERMPPQTREERHLHEQANQLFFLLEGSLTIDLDDVIHQLAPSDALNIKPGQMHQVRNDSQTKPARFLVISSPTTQGDRISAET